MAGSLGIAYHNLAQYERAVEHFTQALTISRELGDRPSEGIALHLTDEQAKEK